MGCKWAEIAPSSVRGGSGAAWTESCGWHCHGGMPPCENEIVPTIAPARNQSRFQLCVTWLTIYGLIFGVLREVRMACISAASAPTDASAIDSCAPRLGAHFEFLYCGMPPRLCKMHVSVHATQNRPGASSVQFRPISNPYAACCCGCAALCEFVSL